MGITEGGRRGDFVIRTELVGVTEREDMIERGRGGDEGEDYPFDRKRGPILLVLLELAGRGSIVSITGA